MFHLNFTFITLTLLHLTIRYYSNVCNAATVSDNTRRTVSNPINSQGKYNNINKQCTCHQCCESFMVNVCQLTMNSINTIKAVIVDNMSQEMHDTLCTREFLSLINSVKQETTHCHLFCYNLIRRVFDNAVLLHGYVTIMKLHHNNKKKRDLMKILAVLKKDGFFLYSESYISVNLEFHRKTTTPPPFFSRVDHFHRIIISENVVQEYISRLSEDEGYSDMLSLFGIVLKYIRFLTWSEGFAKSLSYFCNDTNVILAISNIFIDIHAAWNYIDLEFISNNRLSRIEFVSVTFSSDNIFIHLREFVHLESVIFYQCNFLKERLLCYSGYTQCEVMTSFKKNLDTIGTLNALSFEWSKQLIENNSIVNLKLCLTSSLNFQLLRLFKKLKYLSVSFEQTWFNRNGDLQSIENQHFALINCVAGVPTLNKLLVKGLLVTVKTNQAMNELRLVEYVQLCCPILYESSNIFTRANSWVEKLQTLSFQIEDLDKIFLLARYNQLSNLKEIIIGDCYYLINVNLSIIKNLGEQKINTLVIICAYNPVLITFIESLKSLKTLKLENPSNSSVIEILKLHAIKHRVERLIIMNTCLENTALEKITMFTRLKHLTLHSIKFIPNLDIEVLLKFKRRITLRIVTSRLNVSDFYAIKKCKTIKDFQCYDNEESYISH